MVPLAGVQPSWEVSKAKTAVQPDPVTGVPPGTAGAVASPVMTPLSGAPLTVPGTCAKEEVEVARNTRALAWALPAPSVWLAASRLSGPQAPKSGKVNCVPSTVTALSGFHPASCSCALENASPAPSAPDPHVVAPSEIISLS